MKTEYMIKTADGIGWQEPEIGAWYCGFEVRYNADTGEETTHDGELAEYVGEGEFYDEGCDERTKMEYYDFLVKQG